MLCRFCAGAGKTFADLLRRGPAGSWPRELGIITEGDLTLDSIGLRTLLANLYRSTRLRRSPQA